tara:strand:- start:3 stop:299 length:297 start_codon:yes stop_codon:yes gene_type:complete
MTYNKKNIITSEEEIDFYNYLVSKNYQNSGFFRYGFFKRIMKWYFGELNEYRYRKIFSNMVNQNLFFRIDTNGQRSYLYSVRVEKPEKIKDIGYVEWI